MDVLGHQSPEVSVFKWVPPHLTADFCVVVFSVLRCVDPALLFVGP